MCSPPAAFAVTYLKHDYADETKHAWVKLGVAIGAALSRQLRLVSRS